jgi:hypothetical protein
MATNSFLNKLFPKDEQLLQAQLLAAAYQGNGYEENLQAQRVQELNSAPRPLVAIEDDGMPMAMECKKLMAEAREKKLRIEREDAMKEMIAMTRYAIECGSTEARRDIHRTLDRSTILYLLGWLEAKGYKAEVEETRLSCHCGSHLKWSWV